jgi:uncharacterized membrane protein YedE/YeeE
MTEFTPIQSFAGGLLIGLAAVLLMVLNGRIAGMTGIISGLLPPVISSDWDWRAAFLTGAVISPLFYLLAIGGLPALQVDASPALLLASGMIVGVGVTFGSGCTSGHGVCGLARLSPRSVAAVLTFMASAGATVFVVRHVLGG